MNKILLKLASNKKAEYVLVILLISALFGALALSKISFADEVEPNISNDSWHMRTVLYDSESVSTSEDFNFNVTESGNSKSFIVQVNYTNDNIKNTYEPGDLILTIPGLLYVDSNYNSNPMIASSTSDDANISSWRLVSSTNESTVITNNVRIEENTNFQGNVQFEFKPYGAGLIHGKTYQFMAVLRDKDGNVLASSNIANMNFTSNRVTYSSVVTAEKLTALDGLPDDASNYIWVKYFIAFDKEDLAAREIYLPMYRWNYTRSYATTEPYKSSFYILDKIPEDAIAYDLSMNKIEREEDGVKIREYRCDHYRAYTYLLVGYPKGTYDNSEIQNDVEVHGMYFDESEIVTVTSASATVNLSEFAFEYSGQGQGGFLKTNSKTNRLSKVKSELPEGGTAAFDMQLMYTYGGVKEDIEMGDDYVYILDKNNDYTKLNSDEYKFTVLEWNGNKLYNANSARIQDHDLELWVRYNGSSQYEKYNDYKANVKNTVTFPSDVRVTGYKWIIKDVNESIKPDTNGVTYQYNGYDVILSCKVKVNTDKLSKDSKIYNFAYLKLYQNGEWINKGNINTYSEGVTRNLIAPQDLDEHGDYLLRVVGYENVIDNAISYRVTKGTLNNGLLRNVNNEGFVGGYSIQTYFNLLNGYTEDFKGVTYYDLLPEGMDFESVDNITIPNNNLINNVKTKSNKSISLDYLKEHINVTKTINFNDTGRTLVVINLDLSDDPLNLKTLFDYNKNANYYLPTFNINVSVSAEAYLEYGDSYNNYILMDVNDREHIDYLPYSHVDDWNDSLYSYDYINSSVEKRDDSRLKYDRQDVNENGSSEELMFSAYAKLSMSDLVNTFQDVLTTVRTDIDNYTFNNSTSLGNIYTYKLRVRPDANYITNLVIYDNLEQAYENNKHFNGTFESVDTSYAEGKGYNVKVYYSNNPNAGKLAEDNSYREYIEGTTNKNDVKTIAFEFLDSNGNAAVLPPKSYTYVLVNMRAPSEYTFSDIAYNKCFTNWNPTNLAGDIVPDLTGIESNKVTVQLSVEKTDVELYAVNPEQEVLEDAILEVVDHNGDIVDSWSTTDQNKVITLPSGDYTLRQIKPTNGYIVSSELPFTVNDDHTVTINDKTSDSVVLENDYTKVSIDLTDGVNSLIGGKLALFDEEGNKIDEWVTNGERHEYERQLIVGKTYTIKQIEGIKDYSISEDVTFVVSGDGNVQKIDVINSKEDEKTYLTIKNYVTDSDDYIKYKVVIYGSNNEIYDINGQDKKVTYNNQTITTDNKCYAGKECFIYLKNDQTITIGYNDQIKVGTRYSITKEVDKYSTYIDNNKDKASNFIEKQATSRQNSITNVTELYSIISKVKVPKTSKNISTALFVILLMLFGSMLFVLLKVEELRKLQKMFD